MNPSKSYYSTPHDSTVGVGGAFYLAGFVFLLTIAIGVGYVAWTERRGRAWRGRVYKAGTRWVKDDGTMIVRGPERRW